MVCLDAILTKFETLSLIVIDDDFYEIRFLEV